MSVDCVARNTRTGGAIPRGFGGASAALQRSMGGDFGRLDQGRDRRQGVA